MYPIFGKRYKCKDCKEAIDFDLCESCYNISSKLPGRFNQQYKPDHRFELNDSHMLYSILLQKSLSMEAQNYPETPSNN
ncbi:E3 ubiquitin-protein ligase PRT1 [Dendrobium catenatum]|uniref:E3 ubiquitin-protein ligase PRT1 n=1 Tax=Dendrobium catenatum TaxID=906689 RepID=A0A2I0VHI0_9ASPA|nr:E3 ubiquitin-protein ligase PRT1 [Dendrobium catenatum]